MSGGFARSLNMDFSRKALFHQEKSQFYHKLIIIELPLTRIVHLFSRKNFTVVLSPAYNESADLYDKSITGLNIFTCTTA